MSMEKQATAESVDEDTAADLANDAVFLSSIIHTLTIPKKSLVASTLR